MIDRKIPELLCPAGSAESLYAAVQNGADAVYIGGRSFNARKAANNFTDEELEIMIDYAHRRNVKIYITLNTLFKDKELTDVMKFAEKMYTAGADAFIMQDIGAASEIKRLFPKIKLHASTQMTVHSLGGAKYLESYGFDRVVLSRELSLKEINEISSGISIETESFVHGALCVSYSGQCLMSSIIGGRSGNRGRCAQPCRMQYDLDDEKGNTITNGYLLSPRDMMTLDILNDIIESGVGSLKIEGRMKSPEYVGIVTKSYKEYLDNIVQNANYTNKKAITAVTQVFNRGGSFSDGYYHNFSGSAMMSTKTPKSTGTYIGRVFSYEPPKIKNGKGKCIIKTDIDLIPGDGIEIWTECSPHVGTGISKNIEAGDRFIVNITGNINKDDKVYKSYDKRLSDNGKKLYLQDTKKLVINGSIEVKAGNPLKITLHYGDIVVEKIGDIAEKADKQPLTEEKIIAQFSKTGNTTYDIAFEYNRIDNDIYVSLGSINALRRSAIEAFDKLYVNSFKREVIAIPQYKFESTMNNQEISVQTDNLSQTITAISAGVKRIYYPLKGDNINDIKKAAAMAEAHGAEIYLALPKICRNDDEKTLMDSLNELEETKITGYLVSNYGALNILKQNSILPIVLDYNFNIFNSISAAFFIDQGFDVTLSQELNFEELKAIASYGGELVVHGRQIMMITHQCPAGLYAGIKNNKKYCRFKGKDNKFYLTDRKKARLPVHTECSQCVSYILNSQTLCMVNKYHDLNKTSVKYFRLVFFNESNAEVEQIVSAYQKMILNGYSEAEAELVKEGELTYGHYYRGVE